MINLIRERCIQEIMHKHQSKIDEYVIKIKEKREQNNNLEIRNKDLLVETEELKRDNATLGTVLAAIAKKSFDNDLIKLQREYLDNEDIMKQNVLDIAELEKLSRLYG